MNDEYRDLIAYLKIVYQNFTVLHHNVMGHGFYTIHPLLGDFYDKIAGITDSLIERGMVEGMTEPDIKDCILKYGDELVPVMPWNCYSAMEEADKEFVSIIEKMATIRTSLKPDVQSDFDAKVYDIEIERYKVKQFLGGEGKPDEDDE